MTTMMHKSSDFIVTAAAQRPRRMDGTCFYCGQAIGAPHEPDCVLIHKQVKVRMTIELEMWMPADWDAEMTEFHLNESSWCKSNILQRLEALESEHGCLCHAPIEFKHVEDLGEPYLSEAG